MKGMDYNGARKEPEEAIPSTQPRGDDSPWSWVAAMERTHVRYFWRQNQEDGLGAEGRGVGGVKG